MTENEIKMIEELKLHGVTVEELRRIGLRLSEVKPTGGELRILVEKHRGITKIPITKYE